MGYLQHTHRVHDTGFWRAIRGVSGLEKFISWCGCSEEREQSSAARARADVLHFGRSGALLLRSI